MDIENNNEISEKYSDIKADEYKQKFELFFNKIANFSKQSIGKVFLFLSFNLLSVCWLVFYVKQLFDLSITSVVIMFVIICIPALLIFKLYLTLQEVQARHATSRNSGTPVT
ncbi:MAG: hypothetical protein methR_P0738 [Methyloprofundus sp.]|nr:MAG: hypothetical protein methR_P0738 [Methyloprofundus sp.]